MVLTSVRRDDAGFYQCIVNNTVATDAVAMATAYLHVTSHNRDVTDRVRQRTRGRHRGSLCSSSNGIVLVAVVVVAAAAAVWVPNVS